jgi:hypothetical protein
MLTSEAQARDGAGLTSTIGVAHRGRGDGATLIDPGSRTANPADTPSVPAITASAQSSRAHVLRSHKALTS